MKVNSNLYKMSTKCILLTYFLNMQAFVSFKSFTNFIGPITKILIYDKELIIHLPSSQAFRNIHVTKLSNARRTGSISVVTSLV